MADFASGFLRKREKLRGPSQFYARWRTLARQHVEAAPLPAFAQVRACRSEDLSCCRMTTASAVSGKDGHNPLVSAKICVPVPKRLSAEFQQKTENELLGQKFCKFCRRSKPSKYDLFSRAPPAEKSFCERRFGASQRKFGLLMPIKRLFPR